MTTGIEVDQPILAECLDLVAEVELETEVELAAEVEIDIGVEVDIGVELKLEDGAEAGPDDFSCFGMAEDDGAGLYAGGAGCDTISGESVGLGCGLGAGAGTGVGVGAGSWLEGLS